MKTSIIEQSGYTWVALPREGILPFTLLEQTQEGFFKRITNAVLGIAPTANALEADIFSFFPTSGRSDLRIKQAENVASFKGYDILSVKAGYMVSNLEGNTEAKTKISQATKRLYNFQNLQILKTHTEILLEEHLNFNKPNTQALGFLEKLQNGKMYVVVEVLQTTEFSVQDASDFEISGTVTAEAIEGYLAKIKASASFEESKSQKLAYKGDKPVTFALKAYKILYEKDKNGKEKYTLSKTPLRDVRHGEGLDAVPLGLDWVDVE